MLAPIARFQIEQRHVMVTTQYVVGSGKFAPHCHEGDKHRNYGSISGALLWELDRTDPVAQEMAVVGAPPNDRFCQIGIAWLPV
jgi:hypothetical protein